jgi:hypothetical protein
MVGWTTLHQCCRLEYASCRRNDRFWPRLCEKPKTLDCDRISYSFKTALGAHIGKPNLLLTSNLRTSFLSGFDFLCFHTGWARSRHLASGSSSVLALSLRGRTCLFCTGSRSGLRCMMACMRTSLMSEPNSRPSRDAPTRLRPVKRSPASFLDHSGYSQAFKNALVVGQPFWTVRKR